MKKMLSLFVLFFTVAVGACSTAPDSTTLSTGQQIAKTLEGTWQATTPSTLFFVFSSTNLLFGTDPLTLANPDSIVLGDKTYAVYVNDDETRFQIFRSEENNLFNITGLTLDNIRQRFIDEPSDFTTVKATRKQS